MNDKYRTRLKEENKSMKDARESCFADKINKRNRMTAESIRSGRVNKQPSLSKEEIDKMHEHVYNVSEILFDVRSELSTSWIRNVNKRKTEIKLLSIINECEKMLKVIE